MCHIRDMVYYGDMTIQVQLSFGQDVQKTPQGNYVIMTGVTPTPLGEGVY